MEAVGQALFNLRTIRQTLTRTIPTRKADFGPTGAAAPIPRANIAIVASLVRSRYTISTAPFAAILSRTLIANLCSALFTAAIVGQFIAIIAFLVNRYDSIPAN